MISNPKYGYCNIKMGDYEDLCDTTDLPLNIARAFISYYESGSGYSYIKNDTYFMLEKDKVYILKEIKENKENFLEAVFLKNISEIENKILNEAGNKDIIWYFMKKGEKLLWTENYAEEPESDNGFLIEKLYIKNSNGTEKIYDFSFW